MDEIVKKNVSDVKNIYYHNLSKEYLVYFIHSYPQRVPQVSPFEVCIL